MKTAFLTLLSFLIYFNAFAQPTNRTEPVLNTQFGTITEFIAPKELNRQTIYLLENWKPGTIYLKEKQKIAGFKINYDLELNMVEIQTKQGIKVIPAHLVNEFKLLKNTTDSISYLSCNFLNTDPQCFGIYEIAKAGKNIQLLKQTKIEVLRANFNPITNTGYKTDKVVKKDKYYIADANAITELKNNADFTIFSSKANEMKAYAKSKKLSLKKPEDVAALISYYNSI